MNLITGKLGQNHFTSTQHRNIFRSIVGDGSLVVSNVGAGMATSVTGSNQISISDGLIFHHGCAFEIPYGSVETVEVSNGTQGYNRIDAIVLRWQKNSSGIESASWVVVEGTPTTGTPTAPRITAGNMNEGDTQDDCLFALATIEGVSLSGVEDTVPEVEATLSGVARRLVDAANVSGFAPATAPTQSNRLTRDDILLIAEAVRAGMEDITVSTTINEKSFKRGLTGMGVRFA